MSVQAMAWVLDECEATGTDRLVLLAIANHLNHGNEDRGWSLGMARIAREARVNEDTARRSIRRMELAGLVRVERTLGGSGRVNRYWLEGFSPTPADRGGSDIHNPRDGAANPRDGAAKPPRKREGNRTYQKDRAETHVGLGQITDLEPLPAPTPMPDNLKRRRA